MTEMGGRSDSRPTVLMNAVGSTSGGGRTYTLALARELERGGDRGLRWELIASPDVAPYIAHFSPTVVRVRVRRFASPVHRTLWEDTALPERLWRQPDCVLVSAGNFGPPIRRRHIVVAQNALHFTDHGVAGTWGSRLRVEAVLARLAVRRARLTLTATRSMSSLVERATNHRPVVNPFGPGLVEGWVKPQSTKVTFLHRTSWGPHKRLADLLHAVERLARTHGGRFMVRSACDPTTPFARSFPQSLTDRVLLARKGVGDHVRFESYTPLEATVLRGHATLAPSAIESFCFPIAEAAAFEMPVIAADTPFARELVGQAAFLFPPHSTPDLADAMARIIEGDAPPTLAPAMRERLSWTRHTDLLAACCRLALDQSSSEHMPSVST